MPTVTSRADQKATAGERGTAELEAVMVKRAMKRMMMPMLALFIFVVSEGIGGIAGRETTYMAPRPRRARALALVRQSMRAGMRMKRGRLERMRSAATERELWT